MSDGSTIFKKIKKSRVGILKFGYSLPKEMKREIGEENFDYITNYMVHTACNDFIYDLIVAINKQLVSNIFIERFTTKLVNSVDEFSLEDLKADSDMVYSISLSNLLHPERLDAVKMKTLKTKDANMNNVNEIVKAMKFKYTKGFLTRKYKFEVEKKPKQEQIEENEMQY